MMKHKKENMKAKEHNAKHAGKHSLPDYLFFAVIAILVLFALALAYIKLFHVEEGAAEPLQPMVRQEKSVRPMYVAGTFYPAQQGTLGIMVQSFLDNAEDKKLGTIKAVIVPHAGYVYSGQTAAYSFRQLEPQKDSITKVFIIGNNHAQGAYFSGISIPNYTHYKTPLGDVELSRLAAQLADKQPFTNNQQSHTSHIIEVELPFLQKTLDDFAIIPMVIGSASQDTINDAAKEINNLLDRNSLVVISSDLSHYHPYDEAVRLDTSCILQIENQSFAGTSNCEACGREAILILLRIAEMNGWKAKILDYKNSGDTSGDKSSVVGYSAIVFYTDASQEVKEVVNSNEQQILLKLARDTVEGYVKEKKQPNLDTVDISDTMKEVRGCFVTLNKHGQLRGCIGHILPQKPLYQCIIENAINAASTDPRFMPVTSDELDDIHIDISVLTLPQDLSYSSEQDLMDQLRPDIDGVVLRSGFRTSTYLPQVWGQLPDKKLFLESLCQKQGSPTDCWKSAKVSVYQAQVFAEAE